jgi:hypothetical protein
LATGRLLLAGINAAHMLEIVALDIKSTQQPEWLSLQWMKSER